MKNTVENSSSWEFLENYLGENSSGKSNLLPSTFLRIKIGRV